MSKKFTNAADLLDTLKPLPQVLLFLGQTDLVVADGLDPQKTFTRANAEFTNARELHQELSQVAANVTVTQARGGRFKVTAQFNAPLAMMQVIVTSMRGRQKANMPATELAAPAAEQTVDGFVFSPEASRIVVLVEGRKPTADLHGYWSAWSYDHIADLNPKPDRWLAGDVPVGFPDRAAAKIRVNQNGLVLEVTGENGFHYKAKLRPKA